MKYQVQATLLIIFASLPVHAQWQTVYPVSGTHSDLAKAIVPHNTLLHYAIGNDVVTSPNQGGSWAVRYSHTVPQQITSATRNYDVVFTAENTGYMAYQNRVFKTTDGGGNWQNLLELAPNHTKYQSSAYFQALYFADNLTGYAVGDFKKIFKTTDGGAHWETLSWSNATAPFTCYTGVYFQDAQNGYITGYEVADIQMNFGFDSFILRTNDGGQHWQRYEVPTVGDYRKLSVQFVSETTGFIHTTISQYRDALFVTRDRGETWTACGPGDLYRIRCAHWVDDQTGFASGDTDLYLGATYRTDDAGAHWAAVDMPVSGAYPQGIISDIRFSDTQHGFAVGQGGYIAATQNGGTSWTLSNDYHPMFYALTRDGDTDAYASPGYGLYRSGDRGESWQRADQSDSLLIRSMIMTAPGEGYFYGYRNHIYHVTQSTASIEALQLPVIFQYSHELIATADSIFVAGATITPKDLNVFLKSGDGGKTWAIYPITGKTHTLISLEAHNGTFFAGTTGAVYTSTDGGKSWKHVSSLAGNTMTALRFLNKTVAVAALVSGEIKRSGDGGMTWTDVSGPFPANNTSIGGLFVEDAGTLYAFGSKNAYNGVYGALWKSADGGLTWHEETLPGRIDRSFTAMTMDAEYLYATGGNSQIIRKPRATGEDPTPTEQASAGHIFTVYPVPAEKEVFFSIPGHEALQQVYVYNGQGIRQMLPAERWGDGLYRVAVQGLAPGVYVLEAPRRRARFVKR